MACAPLPWGPREGKILCIVELDLAPDIDCNPEPLDDVLRMSIDYCASSVRQVRLPLDPQPPAPKLMTDFESLSEFLKYVKREQEEQPWYPSMEVIPPTTLFTDSQRPGIRINLSVPPEIADEVRHQFKQQWKELMSDIKHCGVGPFLNVYRKPAGCPICGGPPAKVEYPLSRWGHGSGLICTKNPHTRQPTPHSI